MPELPEVEIYRRYFDAHALGQRIAKVEITDRRILYRTTAAALGRSLARRSFSRTHRHGKHLFADAGEGWLYLHFGMSGDLAFEHRGQKAPRFARMICRFQNGSFLAFEDMRLFGRVGMVEDPSAFVRRLGLGPDPLDSAFTPAVFVKLLSSRRGSIKSLLMDQRNLSGLGNLWVDELLYQSGVHPRKAAESITPARARQMFVAMRRLLLSAVERQEREAAYPRTWLIDRRDAGARCGRCGGEIVRTVVFGRTTYYCRQHQK